MDKKITKILYKLAVKAYKKNEVPVSAVIVKNNKIISKAYNKKNIKQNVFLHAEIICLQKAYKKLKRWNLNDCIMYVTLEPCNMCKEAIQNSRIDNVIYFTPKSNLNNTYKKTRYEQMYDTNKDIQNIFHDFFKNIRK